MNVRMQEGETETELSFSRWDVGIAGRSLDDRGKAAIGFLTRHTDRVIHLEYDPDEFKMEVDGVWSNVEDFDTYMSSLRGNSIALEATTLGFVEILFCCRSMYQLKFAALTMIYVEPLRYSRPRRSHLLHRRDFELSDKVPGYKAIPGATIMLTDRTPQRGVFFLGYEEERLERALEDYQMIRPAYCSVVFGVPAFRPGWEMDAFANNIPVIRERNIRGGVHFCGAENPAAAMGVLNDVYSSLSGGERLFVAPIGTKPNGIGVALFVATHPNVGVLYDHPRRRAGRTSQVARWHLFDVDFTSQR
ncbi:MAG: hypothetical protein L0387_43840 [Acidobacteria bacterium]|nr:hypothetical protein [Acidobacteriota bacterium]